MNYVAVWRKIIPRRGPDSVTALRKEHGYDICEESRRIGCLE